jgi:hypothetical protein
MLPANGQAEPMAKAAVAADVHEALDIHAYIAAKIALNLVVILELRAKLLRFVVGQVLHPGVGIDPGCLEYLLRSRQTYAEYICQPYLYSLFPWQIDSRNACHIFLPPRALALFVSRVPAANHANDPMSLDYPAIFANGLDRRPYLHFKKRLLSSLPLRYLYL